MGVYTNRQLLSMDVIELYEMVLQGKVIKTFPKGFWQQHDAKEKAAICTRYLIENVLKYDEIKIKKKMSCSLFMKYKLNGMLQYCFNNSPYEIMNNAYPGKYKEWEFLNVPRGYWENEQNRLKAVKWLIEEKLKLSEEQLKEELSFRMFDDNGLNGMLQKYFNNSPYEAVNTIYPGKYNPWDFKIASQRYWRNKENGIKATRWLIEEKLRLNQEDIKMNLSKRLFVENGLGGMLQYCFNGSPYEAINAAYPNKFKQWEFKMVPNKYWNRSNGIKATRWLVEEKLQLSGKELNEQLSIKMFKDNRLGGMLQCCFNGSAYDAVRAAYPDRVIKSKNRKRKLINNK